jgi:hypothetical protein
MVTQMTIKATLRSLSSTFARPRHNPPRHGHNGTASARAKFAEECEQRIGIQKERAQNAANARGKRACTGVRATGLPRTLALKVPAAKFPARRRNEASAFCSLSGSIVLTLQVPRQTRPTALGHESARARPAVVHTLTMPASRLARSALLTSAPARKDRPRPDALCHATLWEG